MQTYLTKDLGMEIILDGGWDHSPVTGVFTRERTQRFTHTELREDKHMKTEMELGVGLQDKGSSEAKGGKGGPSWSITGSTALLKP